MYYHSSETENPLHIVIKTEIILVPIAAYMKPAISSIFLPKLP